MKIIDISLPLHQGLPAWPGDIKFQRKESRGTAITSKIIMSSHTGTHMDAPKHFLFNDQSVDKFALGKLVGRARVFTLDSREQISRAEIAQLPIQKGDRVLLKTRNSKLVTRKKFTPDYVSLSLAAAKHLAAKKISLIGIDYFGIETKSAPGHPVHKTLLKAGIVIVEGLDLSKVKPGVYNLAALPLRILDGDGSPARVILWK